MLCLMGILYSTTLHLQTLAALLHTGSRKIECLRVTFLGRQVKCSKHSISAQPICLAQQRQLCMAGGENETGQELKRMYYRKWRTPQEYRTADKVFLIQALIFFPTLGISKYEIYRNFRNQSMPFLNVLDPSHWYVLAVMLIIKTLDFFNVKCKWNCAKLFWAKVCMLRCSDWFLVSCYAVARVLLVAFWPNSRSWYSYH